MISFSCGMLKKEKKAKASPLSHCKPIPNPQEKIRVVVIKGTNFNCTINKYQGYNVEHDDYSWQSYMVYGKVFNRIDTKFSSQGEICFFFSFYCIFMS